MSKLSLELYSPVTDIQLFSKIENVSKMRVEGFRYITATTGNKYMLLQVGNFTNNRFITSTQNMNYSKIIFLDPAASQMVRYTNIDYSSFDHVGDVQDLYNFTIRIYIDGLIASDVSPANPIQLSLHFE